MTKRLYRSEKDKIIGGVCGGLAEYLNIDPIIVRVLFIVALVSEGFGFLLYIILWIVMPPESIVNKQSKKVKSRSKKK